VLNKNMEKECVCCNEYAAEKYRSKIWMRRVGCIDYGLVGRYSNAGTACGRGCLTEKRPQQERTAADGGGS